MSRSTPARASFTLVGLIDCGAASGTACSLHGTLTIVSDDSGAPTRYTIDISQLKGELPKIDQDDLFSVEIERLPDGTLVAVNLTDVSDQHGTGNPGTTGAKSATKTRRGRRPRQPGCRQYRDDDHHWHDDAIDDLH